MSADLQQSTRPVADGEKSAPVVTSVDEVLERVRELVVATLGAQFDLPESALRPGGASSAVQAWTRLQHRTIAPHPRRVELSPRLAVRPVSSELSAALATIQSEFVAGMDMTQRLSRQFFRATFNDFLFNNFGIHHFHLGVRDAAFDRSGTRPMALPAKHLLFGLITPTDCLFLDVLSHDVFNDAAQSRMLAQLALQLRPEFMSQFALPGVVGVDHTFETAFAMAKQGFVTCYELDGRFFRTGGTVLDGKSGPTGRRPCTSLCVIQAHNQIMNTVCRLVEHITSNAARIALWCEQQGRGHHDEIRLSVKQLGNVVVLEDDNSGAVFLNTDIGHVARLGAIQLTLDR